MKRNKKWSILVWSIFLVIFLSFSFIYISTKIQNQIQKTPQSSLFSSQKDEFQKEVIWTDGSIFLATNQEKKVFFPETQSGIILVVSWGPVFYTISSGGILLENGYIFDKSSVIDLQKDIYVKNIWGPTQIKINTQSFSGVIFPEIYQKSTLKVGWQEIIHEIIKESSL